ncbi:hypothetical protein M0812_08604 [Anaeramoeba flamelloides]|uniref:Uncharacterized protein n=1 Tax=Anaeramoeba flamelloides TaxID=1746091 RepID=A0AAV7ZVW9_9EUKA|nr:hypothetical protein M0812_08604 [Anaeramoeba flamelloides]
MLKRCFECNSINKIKLAVVFFQISYLESQSKQTRSLFVHYYCDRCRSQIPFKRIIKMNHVPIKIEISLTSIQNEELEKVGFGNALIQGNKQSKSTNTIASNSDEFKNCNIYEYYEKYRNFFTSGLNPQEKQWWASYLSKSGFQTNFKHPKNTHKIKKVIGNEFNFDRMIFRKRQTHSDNEIEKERKPIELNKSKKLRMTINCKTIEMIRTINYKHINKEKKDL